MSLAFDPVDSLVGNFYQLTPFQKPHLKNAALQLLESNRVFPTACQGKVSALVEAMKAYVMGPEHFERDDMKARRLDNVVALLTEEENLNLVNSRVIATIVKQFMEMLYLCNRELGDSFTSKIVDNWAFAKYIDLWNKISLRSKELEQAESGNLLSQLRFFSAFMADLHAEGVISVVGFYGLIDLALPLIQCAKLFNLFLFHCLSRGLSGSGAKLVCAARTWHRISVKWDTLRAFYKPDDISGAVVRILYKDAMEEGTQCAIEWSLQPCKSADLFCQDLAGKLLSRTLRDQDEEMEEDTELVEDMCKVRPDRDMDDLSESFQDVTMN